MPQMVYIETVGCQMNKLDSELIIDQLARLGYQVTRDPTQAAVIIFNTCSVRQHAEDKVISKIASLPRRPHDQPHPVLALVGCMAQRLGRQLLDSYPQIDVVCAPGQLHRLRELIQQAQSHGQRVIALNDTISNEQLEQLDTCRSLTHSSTPFSAYVRIMRGCNKHCSYCVVPYVRGPEQSRPLDHILQEAHRLAQLGVKEITLLGQTVNSYKYANGDKTLHLADVLEKLHDINGLQRLRFVTSHPQNFDERILKAMAQLPKVCEYLHIPAQSGSDRILKAMNRHYTVQQYLRLIERARQLVSSITIAGDFIVGYCNEDEHDFTATANLMRKVRYKNCFIFKYSPRPGTKAHQRLADNVPQDVKRRRNQELLALQNEICLQDNQRLIGQTVQVLVEGPSKKPHLNNSPHHHNTAAQQNRNNPKTPPPSPLYPNAHVDIPQPAQQLQLMGRTPGDHIVVFNGTHQMIGQIINLKVTKVSALTLFAQLAPA